MHDERDLIPDEDLRRRLSEIARASGKSVEDVVREALEAYCTARQVASNGMRESRDETLYDAFQRAGLIGCISAPPDMSTNPKYMEGFGEGG